jgi:hypothetical protein
MEEKLSPIASRNRIRVLIAWDFDSTGMWLLPAIQERDAISDAKSEKPKEVESGTVYDSRFLWPDFLSNELRNLIQGWNDEGSELYGPLAVQTEELAAERVTFWQEGKRLAESVFQELGPDSTVWYQSSDGIFTKLSFNELT